MKSYPAKRSSKRDKEKKCLLSLVEYYIKTGKAVGSSTLKEVGFFDLSSATIRNYFAALEEEGYLIQHHTSGGRIPTPLAFRFYADSCLAEIAQSPSFIAGEEAPEIKEIALFLQHAAEEISVRANLPVFLSAPRFDQDFVVDIKCISIDHARTLSVLLTSFGQVYTELLHVPKKLSHHTLQHIEAYCHARLMGKDLEEELTDEEHELAKRIFQETMSRYLVSYANFSEEDLFRTGFSKLLAYPEFQEAESLASSLSIFENRAALRGLIRETVRAGQLKYWIGEELFHYLSSQQNCAVIAIPYHIGHKKVGAIGVIGPMRLAYRQLFPLLQAAEVDISRFLEKSLHKYRLSFRTPHAKGYDIGFETKKMLSGPQRGDT